MSTTVRDVTYGLLRQLQLTTFFGNPGSTEEPFLQNFPNDFQYVLALQEASALAMADGYAQNTRRPAFVNLHTAPGLGNALGNLVSAFANKTPLVVTAGQQTRNMLLIEPWLTNTEATTLPRPWVKWSYEPSRAIDIPAALMRAYAIAAQPPAGPVFLSLPMDDWDQPCSTPAALRSVCRRVAGDPAVLADFADRLKRSQRPALILGAGVDRSEGWNAAIALAVTLRAAVYAAPASERTPFPETHPLYAGALPFAIAPLAAKLRGHDLVLVVGAPVFRYYPYAPGDYLPAATQLLHITDDPQESARAPVGDSLIADSHLAMVALKDLLPAAERSSPPAVERRYEAPARRADGLLGAAEVFAEMHSALHEDVILVQESPSNLAILRKHWPITRPASFFSMASGGLGWGLPAAVGMAVAEKQRQSAKPVVCIIGDGSLQYCIQALWTAVQQQLSLLIVVMRNGQYGILKSFAQQEKVTGIPGLDIPGIDCVALATGYGCAASRLTDRAQIASEMRQTLAKGLPHLLEIQIAADIEPLIHA